MSLSCSAISLVKEKVRSRKDVEGCFVRSLEVRFHVNGHHEWSKDVSVDSSDSVAFHDWVVSIEIIWWYRARFPESGSDSSERRDAATGDHNHSPDFIAYSWCPPDVVGDHTPSTDEVYNSLDWVRVTHLVWPRKSSSIDVRWVTGKGKSVSKIVPIKVDRGPSEVCWVAMKSVFCWGLVFIELLLEDSI